MVHEDCNLVQLRFMFNFLLIFETVDRIPEALLTDANSLLSCHSNQKHAREMFAKYLTYRFSMMEESTKTELSKHQVDRLIDYMQYYHHRTGDIPEEFYDRIAELKNMPKDEARKWAQTQMSEFCALTSSFFLRQEPIVSDEEVKKLAPAFTPHEEHKLDNSVVYLLIRDGELSDSVWDYASEYFSKTVPQLKAYGDYKVLYRKEVLSVARFNNVQCEHMVYMYRYDWRRLLPDYPFHLGLANLLGAEEVHVKNWYILRSKPPRYQRESFVHVVTDAKNAEELNEMTGDEDVELPEDLRIPDKSNGIECILQ
ncbi:hypothetical protein B9Z55_025210 [Caenorhabditis nigoni]|uniref:Uncharacterized protein n=2 Tax=Caenorhabditis nigoni TaxID=1611254 RepID=A0A2G5SXF4_9PELO|nr:hypothetical protein B9Z55_025210 [Caenorhabditis nigoni]